ncbi:hypothetical protein TNCV_5020561 [Trichonephila clavipes]|nr:hypothetical protein TNCV_5020561 [Trichonephila clavipes]
MRCFPHSRQESISDENPTSFLEDTSMPYPGFEPEPTRLQSECHKLHTWWGGPWVSSHVNALGNEIADCPAREDNHKDFTHGACPTPSEIAMLHGSFKVSVPLVGRPQYMIGMKKANCFDWDKE